MISGKEIIEPILLCFIPMVCLWNSAGTRKPEKKDPGNRDATDSGCNGTDKCRTRDVEATIDGVKYAPIAKRWRLQKPERQ